MLCWTDVETTGLDERTDSLLEVGFIITTDQLRTVAETSIVLVPQRKGLDEADSMIQNMHAKNGLADDMKLRGVNLTVATAHLQNFLESNLAKGETPLCGSSVHFDRRFLAFRMPAVEQWFHYRNVDVSSIKELMTRWASHAEVAKMPPPRKKHRVLEDIRDTLNELRFYRERFMSV